MNLIDSYTKVVFSFGNKGIVCKFYDVGETLENGVWFEKTYLPSCMRQKGINLVMHALPPEGVNKCPLCNREIDVVTVLKEVKQS